MTLTKPAINDQLDVAWTGPVTDDINNLTASFSRYTGTSTAINNGSWKAMPFATLAEGTGLGITTADNTTWTLSQAGIWTVTWGGVCGTTAGHTGTLYGLFTTTGFGTAYREDTAALLAGQAAGSVSCEIKSDGTVTVVAAAYGVGAAPSFLTTPMAPTITFSFKTS